MSPFEPQLSQKIMIAPLKYIDNNVTLSNFVILTPPLEVLFHDLQTGKLVLSLAEHATFATKLSTMQAYLATTLYLHQQSFFGFVNPTLTTDFFRRMIFPLVYNKKLTLYMGNSAQSVRVYGSGPVQQGMQSALQQGEKVRIAFQLHGISILTHPSISILQTLLPIQTDASGGNLCKLRFQQSVKAIYRVAGVSGSA
jgi:hypothetical protein